MQFGAKRPGQKRSVLGSVCPCFPSLAARCHHRWSRVQFILSAPGSAGRPGCWWRCPEHLLRGVGDVEEAICVPVAGINFPHAGGHAGHAFLSHKEEQSLGGVQRNLIPNRKKCKKEVIEGVDTRMANLTALGRQWREDYLAFRRKRPENKKKKTSWLRSEGEL